MSNPYTDQTTNAPIFNFYTDESQLTTQANPSVTELHMIPAGGVSLPSDRYIDFTLPANDGTYTAPADGWVVFEKFASSSGQYVRLSTLAGSVKTCANQTRSSSSSQMLSVSVAVSSGNDALFSYSADGSTETCRFVYANGAPNVSAS